MRIIVQRVRSASVEIENKIISSIQNGLLVFVGFTHNDSKEAVDTLVNKLVNLRIFPDEKDKMNLSVKDVEGELLIVSQFTLYADCHKGNRPSFTTAAKPEQAQQLYDYFVEQCKTSGLRVATGMFGTYMRVSLINDGPVTILLR